MTKAIFSASLLIALSSLITVIALEGGFRAVLTGEAINSLPRFGLSKIETSKLQWLRWNEKRNELGTTTYPGSFDVFDERYRYEDGNYHEMLVFVPMWPVLYEIEPKIIKPYLEKYWYWHTNQANGQIDRHNTRGRGLGFATAAGELILACAYRHTLEPDGPWLKRATQIASAVSHSAGGASLAQTSTSKRSIAVPRSRARSS